MGRGSNNLMTVLSMRENYKIFGTSTNILEQTKEETSRTIDIATELMHYAQIQGETFTVLVKEYNYNSFTLRHSTDIQWYSGNVT
jgi:hypothetical protein